MRQRHNAPLPRLWLMSDERLGSRLLSAVRKLPKGSGVVFRHYSLPREERLVLLDQVRGIAKSRRLMVLVGGHDHGRHHGAFSAPVHSIRERIAAERAGVRLIFISPVFPTRSHPRSRRLGRVGFGLLARNAKVPVVALGGMNSHKARSLQKMGLHGWAAIDALS